VVDVLVLLLGGREKTLTRFLSAQDNQIGNEGVKKMEEAFKNRHTSLKSLIVVCKKQQRFVAKEMRQRVVWC